MAGKGGEGARATWRSYGVTATLVNVVTGELRVEVFRGESSAKSTTRLVAARCDELGPAWRVRTLSSPYSILGDLRNGGRARELSPTYEAQLLGRARRLDLLEVPPRRRRTLLQRTP